MILKNSSKRGVFFGISKNWNIIAPLTEIMKKDNIVLFTWENDVFLKKSLERWITVFKEKHWDFNITSIKYDDMDKVNISSELMSLPFLSEYRLVVIYWIPRWKQKKDWEEWETKQDNTAERYILEIIEDIPEKNIVTFVQGNPDEKWELFKKIKEIWNIKRFDIPSEDDLKAYIRQMLIWIDNDAIRKLMTYKNSDITKIEKELEKLSLYKRHERVTVEDIERFVVPEIEVSIFQLTDAIFALDTKKAARSLDEILQNSNIFSLFSAVISNLRNYLYVTRLHDLGLKKEEIARELKMHPFVVEKSLNNSSKAKILKDFFSKLIDIDRKSKSWELVWDQDIALKTALQKVILDLKKD